jgi:hypothetical protein
VDDKLFGARQFFKESLERLSGEELERFVDRYSILRAGERWTARPS